MKNLSIALNVVLLVAVAFLYYLHYSSNSVASSAVASETSDSTNVPVIVAKDVKASKIVFVNADTLFERYDYVADLRREAGAKKNSLESIYKDKAQKFQNDYMLLQQKAQKGELSSEQAKAEEEGLIKRKGELDQMEKQLGDLMEDTQRKNIQLQQEVNAFLKEYNKGSNYNYILAYTGAGGSIFYATDSLDITKEVLNGLNTRYKAKKGNKK